jgi:L-alanine-DL-glutamate epimerase-like enolase superfamily enzyme/D-alanine-D-alanine ligase-like ATP-grasp enzyme/acylphosphatase
VSGRRSVVVVATHPIEYRMPLKRPYGTARGVTRASSSFLLKVSGRSGGRTEVGVGEGQPRRQLTGDGDLDRAWDFFGRASEALLGEELDVSSRDGVIAEVERVMARLSDMASTTAPAGYEDRAFRGTLLGIEVALLDLVARHLDVSLATLLGPIRSEVQVTVRTLSTQNDEAELRRKVTRQHGVFPTVRVKGTGDGDRDLAVLRLVHEANLEAGGPKPLWIDQNEGASPDEADAFVDAVAAAMAAGDLPGDITLEQPVPRVLGSHLAALQARADAATPAGSRVWIMPDESLWDLSDLEELQRAGGCGAINIKTAKAGGLLASLRMARAAVAEDPDVRLGIGGMVGTSDVTTWSLVALARAMPRLDYLTAVPPSNVVERFTSPLTALHEGSSHLIMSDEPGLGAALDDVSLFSFVTRADWFPPGDAEDRAERPNEYVVGPLAGFDKTQLDNHLIEREALKLGLSTKRFSKLAFVATDEGGARAAFSWTKSNASSELAVGITSDKQSTKLLLEAAGVPVPRGRRIRSGDRDGALAFAERVGYPIVVKPLRGTGGRDVYTDLADGNDVMFAFDQIATGRYAASDLLVEQHIPGATYRVFVLEGTVISMWMYGDGHIVGDGVRTVAELMLQRRLARLSNPHLMNRFVRLDETALHQLEKAGLGPHDVPPSGRRVVFTANPNPQQGGETVEVLDEAHPSLSEAAGRAVASIPGLRFGGVDFICQDHRRPLSEQAAGVCEINAHPAQSSHEFPLFGPSRPVSREIVRCAARARNLDVRAEPFDDLRLRVRVRGRVVGVGFEEWLRDRAQRDGLGGWVRTRGTRSIDALLSGPADAVAAAVAASISGPRRAQPRSVEARHTPGRRPDSFELR